MEFLGVKLQVAVVKGAGVWIVDDDDELVCPATRVALELDRLSIREVEGIGACATVATDGDFDSADPGQALAKNPANWCGDV